MPAIRDFTQGGIFRQLITLAMPLMAVSFIQMTYNMVDIIWIGRLGSKSVAAVGTVGMLMWMMNSFALLSKVSAEVSIGQSIGAKRLDKAMLYASHTTTIAIISGLVFATFFFLFPQLVLSFFRLEADITQEAIRYLNIVTFSVPFMFLILNFSGIYIGTGRSDIPFYFNAVGLVLNIVLDPLFIFGFGFIPEMGSQGAALATTLSQVVVFMLFIRHLRRKKGVLGQFAFWIKLPKKLHTQYPETGSSRSGHECLFFYYQHEPHPYSFHSRRTPGSYQPNHRWANRGSYLEYLTGVCNSSG